MNQRHIAIVGPTASGKSLLALELARANSDFELVSVDSMQVYRGMDIGTAKPSPAEQAEVRHHCLDLVEPDQDFSLAEFVDHALRATDDIESRGKRAILVGGTGLYLQALVDDIQLPGRFPEVAAGFDHDETSDLYQRLQRLDPLAASRIEPENRRRICRALEVTIGSGKPFSSYGAGMGSYPATRFALFGIWLPRDVGRERINKRVAEMIESGLVEEVSELRSKYLLSKTAKQALGYKEIISHLDGLDLASTVGEIERRTRSFARRQRVWFRRDPRIRWFGTADDTRRLLPALSRSVA